jgi:hypothetical protein
VKQTAQHRLTYLIQSCRWISDSWIVQHQAANVVMSAANLENRTGLSHLAVFFPYSGHS